MGVTRSVASSWIGRTTCAAGLALAVLPGTLAPAPALAQGVSAPAVESYFVVVTGEKTPLRCADHQNAYPVAELASGTVLRVEGEAGTALRVAYPPGLTVFVRADDVRLEGNSVKLVKEARPRAWNPASGAGGSWKALFDAPQPAGTTYKLVEPVLDVGGTLQGYRVAAPAGSRGYVGNASVRRATDAEVQAYQARAGVIAVDGGAGVPAPAQPAKLAENIGPGEAAQPGMRAPEAPGIATNPTSPSINPTIDLTQPATPSDPVAINPDANPAGEPNKIEPGAPTTLAGGPASDRAGTITVPAQASERKRANLEELEVTLKAVLAQPSYTAELDELKAEYQRTLDATPAEQARRRQQIQARIDALQLKADLRLKLQQAEAARLRLDESQSRIREQLAELEKTRVYTLIGQLSASTVYDGRRLPLMFRLQSLDPYPKTLGYVRADNNLALPSLLGKVVGVVGEAQMDGALNVNIIAAVRVEELRGVDLPKTPPAPATDTPIPVELPAIPELRRDR